MKIRVDATLNRPIRARADGRVLVIDSFRSWSCGTWVGDLTVEWWRSPPGDDFVEAAAIDGVAVFIRRRLTRILEAAGVTIASSRLPLFGGLRIELDRPELWIDYLDRPLLWAEPHRAVGV